MPREESHPLFAAERPIASVSEDVLGRKDFAISIAKAIQSWSGNDSLVIALTGEWGSGKSSVKNMVVDYLKMDPGESPQMVEFSPWQWAGQLRLQEAFFSELSIAVGRTSPRGGAAKHAHRWRTYGKALSVGSTVLVGMDGLTRWLVGGVAALGIAASSTTAQWLDTTVFWVCATVLATTAVVSWSGRFAAGVAALYEELARAHQKTLAEFKDELKADFTKLDRPLLVVCDDIDRLDAGQTQLLFQLIKANADFPNVVYLLAFQRQTTEAHLTCNGVDGREYLEKIVQVAFTVPTLERERLERVLFIKLDEVLESDPRFTKRFDKARWVNIYHKGLHSYFSNLRDVYRFISTFAFHASLLCGKRALEVNPVDLIGLELLRIFEPEFYRSISKSKSLLTGRASPDRGDRDLLKKRASELLELAATEHVEAAKGILIELFPKADGLLGGYGSGGDEEEWYRELRVCDSDVFDRYFQLAIPSGDISQSELDEVIEFSNDSDRLVEKFVELEGRSLLDTCLNRLEAYKQRIPIEHAPDFLAAIFSIGDRLRADRAGFTNIDPYMHAWRIAYWYVMQETNPRARASILLGAAEKAEGLSILITLLRLDEDKKRKSESGEPLVSDEDGERLRNMCVTRIREWAASPGALSKSHKLSTYLFRWLEWGGSENEVKAWAKELIKDCSGLLNFLASFCGIVRTTSVGSYMSRTVWQVRLSDLEKFVSLDEIEAAVAGLRNLKLTEEQQRAVEAFWRAKKRRDDGKPDEDTFGE